MQTAHGKNRIKQVKRFPRAHRLLALVLCLCVIQTLFCNFPIKFSPTAVAAGAGSGVTSGVTRQADPSTMDTYTDVLNLDHNSRYAGQVWADKTVFAYGAKDLGDRATLWDGKKLTLTKELDGVDGSIELNDDFLHVYSALGSSQEVTGVPPVRTVIVFDNSGSMYNSDSSGTWANQRIALTVEAINRAIDSLMEAGIYNEVSVVLFGDGSKGSFGDTNNFAYDGNSSAVTILPMKRYTPNKTAGGGKSGNYTPYLTAGWNSVAADCNGANPNQKGDSSGKAIGGGWVFVNNDLCGLNTKTADTGATWKGTGYNNCGSAGYTAYRNGTTNIHAGYYMGMQVLMNATKTERVGSETYKCVPSLVMLTDGAATDMMGGDFINPGKTADGAPTSRGFVNDTGNKLRSFTSADRTDNLKEIGNFWDMFVQEEGGLYASAAWHSGVNVSSKTLDAGELENMKKVAETYSDSVASMLMGTLMTTAYYKAAVRNAYNMDPGTDWSIYTISVDMTDPSTIPNGAAQDAIKNGNKKEDGSYTPNAEPKDQLPKDWTYNINSNPFTIDPKEYFYKDGKLDINWLKTKGYIDSDVDLTNPDPTKIPGHTAYPKYSVGEMILQGIVKAAKMLKDWESGATLSTSYQSWQESKNIFRIKKDGSLTDKAATPSDKFVSGKYVNPWGHSNGYLLEKEETMTWPQLDKDDKYGVTTADVVENIDYNERAYYAFTKNGDAGSLSMVFVTILEAIMKPLFQPVNGNNEIGVEDAVTYMDPVGKYMDVKDVKKMALFGQLYDIDRTAVYSYEWNDLYMKNQGKGGQDFPQGWYRGDPVQGDNGGVEYSAEDVPPGCSSKDDAWDNGWIYRLDAQTSSKYVPSLADIETSSSTTPKQRHTEYTFYRIGVSDDEMVKLHMNPAYGSELPSGAKYDENGGHHEESGVYALADIRIWVEDSGDYSDPDVEDSGSISDANFDEALWINIPVNMLPMRTVTVNLGHAKNETADKWEYTTNVDKSNSGYMASFPLRVFYTVGITDEMLNEDNRHLNLAGTVDQKYIQDYKITTPAAASARGIAEGHLEFFANWFNPLNRYDSYASTGIDYTYGDPMVTFSPNTDNRYYIFTKPLPLYNRAYVWVPTTENTNKDTLYTKEQGSWRLVNLREDYNEDDAQYLNPTSFDGRLVAQDLKPENYTGSNTQRQESIWKALGERGISSVKSGDIILMEDSRLYDVTWDGSGTDPFPSDQYFFLAIEYYSLDGKGTAELEKYVVARKGSEFGSAYEAQGISNGDMLCWHDASGKHSENYPYLSRSNTNDDSRGRDYIGTPLDPDTDWYAGVAKGEKPSTKPENNKDYLADGVWVVSAKPGGLRVGSLANSVKPKAGDWNTYATEYVSERFPGSEGLTWGYYSQNITRTANNYNLPTISRSSNIGGENIIVNVYLGNNGRLYVADTTLLVTKTVSPYIEGTSIDTNEEFKFQVFVDGFTGTHDAIVVRKNAATNTWQRQFHYIDLELDGKLFLQTSSGKAMTDSEGCRLISEAEYKTDGSSDKYVYATTCKSNSGKEHEAGDPYDPNDRGPYYVYVGSNEYSRSEIGASRTGLRVYHNNLVDGNGTVDQKDVVVEYFDADGKKVDGVTDAEYSGIRKFYADKVWLVEKNIYESFWMPQYDDEGKVVSPGFDPADAETTDITSKKGYYSTILEYGKDDGGFELLTLNPMAVDTTEVLVDSPYLTTSAYWTKKAYFGYKTNPDGTMSGDPLTESDLYDGIIPSADRPAFDKYTNSGMAQNTAEITLRHGYGLLFSSIPLNANYRITEKLEGNVYTLKELTHIQQYGSACVYRPGIQKIPVYTKEGAVYGPAYPSLYQSAKTPGGLTWKWNSDGSENKEATVNEEPFNHTNAVLWECYATMKPNELGNHHHPKDAGTERAVFYNGNDATDVMQDVRENPSCEKVDIPLSDGRTIHYMYKDGELVDPHYEGEGSVFLRDANRYIVSPTVHFAVDGETQDMATSPLPAEPSTDYTGVYSVFGNTGTFEEQAHYVNSYAPKGSIAVLKYTGKGDILTGAGFTLYEVDEEGNIIEDPPARAEVKTELMYMQPLDETDAGYAKYAQTYAKDGKKYPVRKETTGDKDSLYYFRPLTDDERTKFENGTLDEAQKSRIRAVAEFNELDTKKRYMLKETTVPDGYLITHQPREIFDFKDGDGNLVLNMLYEVKNFNPLELPETGGLVTCLVTIGAFALLLGIYMTRKKKKRA